MAQTITDPYAPAALELDVAVDARDPIQAAAAVRRAQLVLAKIAAGPGFDARRHRAISGALREVTRGPGPGVQSAIAPLVTR